MSGKRKAPKKPVAKKAKPKKQSEEAEPYHEVVGDNDPVKAKRELIPEPPAKLPDPSSFNDDGSKAHKKLVGE